MLIGTKLIKYELRWHLEFSGNAEFKVLFYCYFKEDYMQKMHIGGRGSKREEML